MTKTRCGPLTKCASSVSRFYECGPKEHVKSWHLVFAIVWREQKDHSTDCYFCFVKTSGYNKKNESKIEYPNLLPAIRPMPHSAEIPVPVFEQLPHLEDLSDGERTQ